MEFGNQNDSRLESANIFTIHYIRKEIIKKKRSKLSDFKHNRESMTVLGKCNF